MAKGKKKRLESADSGALSDLAFLLIIFFIVIAVFNVNKGFMLSLPKKNSTKIVNTEDIIKVDLSQNGTISSGGNVLTLEELEMEIKTLLNAQPNLTFLLRIDPEVPYQNVVSIIEIVRTLKVDNFSFVMSDGNKS